MSDRGIDYDKYPQTRIFGTHGVEFSGSRGDEFYGTCPFTGKSDKFYVNRKTWLWDSKTAGLSGNIRQFLTYVHREYRVQLERDAAPLERVANHRSLPLAAFDGWELGSRADGKIVIPAIDGLKNPAATDRIRNLSNYSFKKKVLYGTPGVEAWLFGGQFFWSNARRSRLLVVLR